MAIKYVVELFVEGHSPSSEQAIENLKDILEEEMPGIYELRIIDVFKNPQQAEKKKVAAVPTLAMVIPPGAKRIIGDLSNKEKILAWLKFDVKKK